MEKPLALLCLASLTSWSILPVSGIRLAEDCCLETSRFPIPPKWILGYFEQHTQQGCPIRATVFITLRGRHLCAPPDAYWVKRLKERLDVFRRIKKYIWASF